jgi:hypothetical protein
MNYMSCRRGGRGKEKAGDFKEREIEEEGRKHNGEKEEEIHPGGRWHRVGQEERKHGEGKEDGKYKGRTQRTEEERKGGRRSTCTHNWKK